MDDPIVAEFVSESLEAVATIEPLLLALEGSADPIHTIHEAFRAFHSMKGAAGFLGFDQLVIVTHAAESLLEEARNGRTLSSSEVTGLLGALDLCARILDAVSQGETDEHFASQGVAAIAALRSSSSKTEGPAAKPTPVPVQEPAWDMALASLVASLQAPAAASPPLVVPKPVVAKATPSDAKVPVAPEPPLDESGPKAGGDSIRVDLGRLDQLMNLVGELIVARRIAGHAHGSGTDEQRQASERQLDRITRDLQDLTMSMRMVPLSGTFRKVQRVVRDLAHRQNKQVELCTEGDGTEVDKSIVERLASPLVHLVRNAVDHGLESSEARERAGKPATGTIRLSARQVGGEVQVVVEDDGRGLDRDKILARGLERGLPIRQDPTDADVFDLMFSPGFTTAETVTDVSGRGVGLDVVRANLRELRGRVEVMSRPGRGCTFILHIPLTLAIVEGMLVRVAATSYTIPVLAVQEAVSGKAVAPVLMPNGTELIRLRGRYMPVLRLAALHGLRGGKDRDGVFVVVGTDDKQVALLVDQLVGQRQTVVKPLPPYVGSPTALSGCSILSSGDISLIVDVPGLLAQV